MELSPGCVVQLNAILFIHLGSGIHQASPPKLRHGCLKHHQRSRGCLESDAGRARLTSDLLHVLRLLPSSLAERQITELRPHWHCQALTVLFLCIVLLVNWFKCYGNDIYLVFDPVNSKQAGIFFFLFFCFFLPLLVEVEKRKHYKYKPLKINGEARVRYYNWIQYMKS